MDVFRPVRRADVRVLVGVIEYHYFAGYSGGFKALIPGVCTEATIQANHRRMTEAGAIAGSLDGNPVRDDIEEAGALVGADFILNVVLDEHKRIVRAVAGHPVLAHRAGCAALDAFGRATVDRPADVVVIGAGGSPKDLNLYQAQKALDNGRHIVRPGGILLLVAECPEGLGHHTFEEWMRDPGGLDAILHRIRREFVIGGHKAAAVALAMKQAAVYLVSSLPQESGALAPLRPVRRPGRSRRGRPRRGGPRPVRGHPPRGRLRAALGGRLIRRAAAAWAHFRRRLQKSYFGQAPQTWPRCKAASPILKDGPGARRYPSEGWVTVAGPFSAACVTTTASTWNREGDYEATGDGENPKHRPGGSRQRWQDHA